MPNFKIVIKYPCAECGEKFRERDLAYCDTEDMDYYCPTCWEDDTLTLPPPPLDMIEEAEKENEKYIHELFAQCQTIPAFNKYVDPVLGKAFAHPVAKIMDKLIGEYWDKHCVKLELKMIEKQYQKLLDGTLEEYMSAKSVKRQYEKRHEWYYRTILGCKNYYYDDAWYFTPSDLCRKTRNGKEKQIQKIAEQVTCYKTGKRVKTRENKFTDIWWTLKQKKCLPPLNILEGIMRKNKFDQEKTEKEAKRWYYETKGTKKQPTNGFAW